MKFCLLVNAGPKYQTATTAYQFSRSLLTKGHELLNVFFYQEGVLIAAPYSTTSAGDIDLKQSWQQLANDFNIKLLLCATAAAKRGIVTEHVAANFQLSGLGLFFEASLHADRTIQFG